MITCCCGFLGKSGVMAHGLQNACFLVNQRSGGGAGLALMKRLQKQLPSATILDLCSISLPDVLQQVCEQQQLLTVAGGDGSIASVLDCIYEKNLELAPAIIPLGTGNDLAKTLAWPDPRSLKVSQLLENIEQSSLCSLDRMRLVAPDLSRTWYNYCSWGLDAEIARHFDIMRKQTPWVFCCAEINKVVYAYLSFRHPGQPIARILRSSVDLPAGSRSLMCANINSYAGGMRLGEQVDRADGSFDIFALPYSIQLAPAFAGLKHLRSLGQAAVLEVELSTALPMQCDGEAWLAAPGHYRIEYAGTVQVRRCQH